MLIESEELRKRLLEKREQNFRIMGNPNKLDDGLMQALAVLGSFEIEMTKDKDRVINDKEQIRAETAERIREMRNQRIRQMFGLSEE